METSKTSSNRLSTKDLVQTALLVALVFIATKFINITLPVGASGGLVHLGNTMLFTIAIIFGKKKGAIAGAIGMGLFDLLSAWAIWAPFTFVIRGVMGYIIGVISWGDNKKGNSIIRNIVAIVISGIWMLVGYYIAEVILYGNWASPVASIPGNITQLVVGLIISVPLTKALKAANIDRII